MKTIVIDKNQELNLTQNNINNDIKIIINKNINLILNIFSENLKSNQRVEIELKQNSSLKHNVINLDSSNTIYNITQNENSRYTQKSINYINNLTSKNNTKIKFLSTNCYAMTKTINIANNSSTIKSEGLITISNNAHKSEGHQKIIGILLDKNSTIDAKPNLEVYHNDVICSHGASITQIDDDKLFYLNSKGFSKEESINLVIKGYFDSILNKTNKEFTNLVENKLKL